VTGRKTAIREDLQSAQRDLLEALDRVGADDWQRGSRNEGWTILSLLTHLATSEHGFVGTVRRMAAGEGGVPADFDPNRWNASQLRRNAEVSPAELRQRLEAAHAELLEFLDTVDDAGLDSRGYLSTGVEGSTEDCLRLSASHKRGHTQDIRAALSLAGV
jgi:uncharacterized protein (TIGR03083 family)